MKCSANRRPIVAVIGAGRADAALERTARRVGELLARAGVHLINGGLGGVMAAAADGFQRAAAELPAEQRGLVVGVLPGNSNDEANQYVDLPIVTHLGEARNCLIVNSAEVCIAIGGEYGTLSEIALALRRGTAVVVLDTGWEIIPGVRKAESPEQAVAWAMEIIAQRQA